MGISLQPQLYPNFSNLSGNQDRLGVSGKSWGKDEYDENGMYETLKEIIKYIKKKKFK